MTSGGLGLALARWVEILPPDAMAELRECLERRPLDVATACSGTDGPIISLMSITTALHAPSQSFRHVWSCEASPRKQQFIRASFPLLPSLFVDVCQLSKPNGAFDVLSGTYKAVDRPHLLVCGFSCKSVSTANCQRARYKTCIQDASGMTGNTWNGVFNFLRLRAPPLLLAENVEGLCKRNDGEEPAVNTIMNQLRSLGYSVGFEVVDSRSYGSVQRRRRVWIFAWKPMDRMPPVERQRLPFLQLLADTFPIDLNAWMDACPASFISSGSASLNARELDVLEAVHERLLLQRKPVDLSTVIVDVSKSREMCVHCCGAIPCVLPNSKMVRMVDYAVLSPLHLAAAQGLLERDLAGISQCMDSLHGQTPKLLCDLAGNAMTVSTAAAVSLVFLARVLCPSCSSTCGP